MHAKLLQSCPILCDPVVCNLPDSSVHGFSRQEYWSGLLCPPPGDLPNPRIEPKSHMSPALAGGFFSTSATWEAPKLSLVGACHCIYSVCNQMLDLRLSPFKDELPGQWEDTVALGRRTLPEKDIGLSANFFLYVTDDWFRKCFLALRQSNLYEAGA